MKRVLQGLGLLSIPLIGLANPFLVSDPSTYPGVDTCYYIMDGQLPVATPVDSTKSCHADLAAVPAGNHTFKAAFAVSSTGQTSNYSGVLSVTLPITSTTLGAPANLRITP